jgi:hypothetical protein
VNYYDIIEIHHHVGKELESGLVFRICDIFYTIRILGFVHWFTDPDPALFISGVMMLTKNMFLAYSSLCVHLHQP